MRVLACMLALVVGFSVSSCRRQDLRTATVKCPQVKNVRCIELVTVALAQTDGVLPESIRIADGTVTVTYDSMKVAIKNLDFVIAGVGFDADDISADKKAREALPADCK